LNPFGFITDSPDVQQWRVDTLDNQTDLGNINRSIEQYLSV
jgi:hypothetical protein